MARRKESIIHETVRTLKSMTRFGESKHEAKEKERQRCIETGERYIPGRVPGIYSFSTYHAYIEHCLDFANWARAEKGAKNLEQARQYAAEYLEKNMDKSAWTVRLKACALAKLYGCSSTDFGVELPDRHREDIHRSREERAHDREFSMEKHRDLVDFCRGTGLRRREVTALAPEDIYERDGAAWVHVRRGKGGREREARVVEQYREHVLAMKARAEVAGRDRVFEHIPNRADIHAWRAEYAQARYEEICRDPAQLERAQRNWERYKEERGYEGPDTYSRRGKDARVFDRAVLLAVSRDMGHNRVDVIARHYLW